MIQAEKKLYHVNQIQYHLAELLKLIDKPEKSKKKKLFNAEISKLIEQSFNHKK